MEASFQSRWYSSWSSVHPELLLLKVSSEPRDVLSMLPISLAGS